MGRLSAKTAFVTGAGGGIGRAIATAMAAEGATVAVADINEKLANETAQSLPSPGKGIAYNCDVSDRPAVREAIDHFAETNGGLNILVNNAVVFHYAPLTEMPEDRVHAMVDVGVKGMIWCSQAAVPHMIKRGGGSIINLSSIAVFFSIRNAGVYSSVKGAIDAFTHQQAVELGPHGIRVNALAPGPVSTPGANSVIDKAGWEARRGRTPLGELVTAEDIGNAAVFLISDAGRTISGVTLKVDGAITLAGA